jgi:hypothetical protein
MDGNGYPSMPCKAGSLQKPEKTQNKVIFFRADPPVFLPNRLILGSFLTVKIFIGS